MPENPVNTRLFTFPLKTYKLYKHISFIAGRAAYFTAAARLNKITKEKGALPFRSPGRKEG